MNRQVEILFLMFNIRLSMYWKFMFSLIMQSVPIILVTGTCCKVVFFQTAGLKINVESCFYFLFCNCLNFKTGKIISFNLFNHSYLFFYPLKWSQSQRCCVIHDITIGHILPREGWTIFKWFQSLAQLNQH